MATRTRINYGDMRPFVNTLQLGNSTPSRPIAEGTRVWLVTLWLGLSYLKNGIRNSSWQIQISSSYKYKDQN